MYYRQSLLTKVIEILAKNEVFDKEFFDDVLTALPTYKRIFNIEYFDKILKALIIINENPKSPHFQQIQKNIDQFKAKISSNPNKSWKYDVDVNNLNHNLNIKHNNLNNLLKIRHNIN